MDSVGKSARFERIDSRQQLVEILGLSGFLRERLEFLESNARAGRGNLQASKEMSLLRHALSEVSAAEVKQNQSGLKLHKNEAGRRLSALLKRSDQVTHADLAYARAMQEFPLGKDELVAERAAYLRGLELLGLASAKDIAELRELNPQKEAANS